MSADFVDFVNLFRHLIPQSDQVSGFRVGNDLIQNPYRGNIWSADPEIESDLGFWVKVKKEETQNKQEKHTGRLRRQSLALCVCTAHAQKCLRLRQYQSNHTKCEKEDKLELRKARIRRPE